MLPGQYLEKRRLMAGYSLTGLARELLMLTGFGRSRAESDFRRLRMTLISAEQGSLHHTPDRIDLIRNFVPLDPAVYLRLVELDQSGAPIEVEGICRNCGCSFHDPCTVPVETFARLGQSTCCWAARNLCSACAGVIERAPHADTLSPIGRQLRDLGEQIRRFDNNPPGPLTEAMLTPAPAAGGPPMTGTMLRLVPNDGEPS
jgi:hypothetical protein